MSLEDWKMDHPNSIPGAVTPDGWVQAIKNSGKWGFINDSGEAITKWVYDDVKSFKNSRALVLKDNVWCVIDSLVNTIFELN